MRLAPCKADENSSSINKMFDEARALDNPDLNAGLSTIVACSARLFNRTTSNTVFRLVHTVKPL